MLVYDWLTLGKPTRLALSKSVVPPNLAHVHSARWPVMNVSIFFKSLRRAAVQSRPIQGIRDNGQYGLGEPSVNLFVLPSCS